MRAVKFAIAIPQFFADGEFDPAAFRTYFSRAEELGFDSAWAQENMFGAAPQLSPLEAMTYAAACTQRLRLGCVVFVSTLHSPVHLAKSVASLDQLSRGRIDVGVGTGGKARSFAAFGVDPDRYLARFTEGIELMKALWTQPSVTFDGEFWQLRDAPMEPRPFQKPHPPLWFGANGRIFPPVPTPTSIRPRLSWSSEARLLARRTGLCRVDTNTTQPSRSRSVHAAA